MQFPRNFQTDETELECGIPAGFFPARSSVLPEDWNYNMQGLATLNRDGIDSVRSAIKELEHHGYVERHRLRNEYGFYGDTEYIIREVPLGEEND